MEIHFDLPDTSYLGLINTPTCAALCWNWIHVLLHAYIFKQILPPAPHWHFSPMPSLVQPCQTGELKGPSQ